MWISIFLVILAFNACLFGSLPNSRESLLVTPPSIRNGVSPSGPPKGNVVVVSSNADTTGGSHNNIWRTISHKHCTRDQAKFLQRILRGAVHDRINAAGRAAVVEDEYSRAKFKEYSRQDDVDYRESISNLFWHVRLESMVLVEEERGPAASPPPPPGLSPPTIKIYCRFDADYQAGDDGVGDNPPSTAEQVCPPAMEVFADHRRRVFVLCPPFWNDLPPLEDEQGEVAERKIMQLIQVLTDALRSWPPRPMVDLEGTVNGDHVGYYGRTTDITSMVRQKLFPWAAVNDSVTLVAYVRAIWLHEPVPWFPRSYDQYINAAMTSYLDEETQLQRLFGGEEGLGRFRWRYLTLPDRRVFRNHAMSNPRTQELLRRFLQQETERSQIEAVLTRIATAADRDVEHGEVEALAQREMDRGGSREIERYAGRGRIRAGGQLETDRAAEGERQRQRQEEEPREERRRRDLF